MALSEFILAAMLLLSPLEISDPEKSIQDEADLSPFVQVIALNFEILDPREHQYILLRSSDFQSDVKLLKKRYNELYDAPLVFDSMRFPDRLVIQEMLGFNRVYRHHLIARVHLEPVFGEDLHAVIKETDQLYQVWDYIRDSRCEYYYITVRRHALKKVLESIGTEAFYNGVYPPSVPTWRFAAID
jgi:hypothetical protein